MIETSVDFITTKLVPTLPWFFVFGFLGYIFATRKRGKKPKKTKEIEEPKKPNLLRAFILFAKDNKFETKEIELKNPTSIQTFDFKNQRYNIRDKSKYLYLKRRFLRKPIRELRSYYRAGNPEPIAWKAPEKKGFTAEDLYVMEWEDTTIKGISRAIAGAKGRKKLAGLKWIIILAVLAGGGAALLMLLPHVLKFFGM